MYFTKNNVKLYYEKFGNKNETIIIFPGWGDNRKTFSNIIENFKDTYTIYIFDYPGFGKSEFPPYDLSINDYSKIFIDFMNEKNVINPIVIGHSFGGRLIITMNGHFNIPFKKIILIDSAGIKRKKTLYQKLKQLSYKLLKKLSIFIPIKLRATYLKKLVNLYGSNDYKNIPEYMRKTFIKIVNEDLKKYLELINSEVLIIWGDKDIDTPINNAYLMNKLIKNSGLVIIKNASHFCYIEYPKYINLILDKLLK